MITCAGRCRSISATRVGSATSNPSTAQRNNPRRQSGTLPAATNPIIFASRERWERSKKLLPLPRLSVWRADVSNTSGPKCVEGFHDETNDRAQPSNHCRQSPDQPRESHADTARPRAIGKNKVPEGAIKNPPRLSLTGPLHRHRR